MVEAVTMMDSWRRRMEENEAVNMSEFSDLSFGRSIAVFPDGQPVLGGNDELSSILFEQSALEESGMIEEVGQSLHQTYDLHIQDELSDGESDLDIPPEPSPKRLASSPAKRGIRLRMPTKPLQEIGFGANVNRNGKVGGSKNSRMHLNTDNQTIDDHNDVENQNPAHTSHSRIPKPSIHKTSAAQNAPVNSAQAMSVSEKLVAIEAEAKEAEDLRQQEQVTHKRKPTKPRANKSSRRRSTLSPEELASLMGVR